MFRKIFYTVLLSLVSFPALAATCVHGDPDHPAVPHAVVRWRDNPNVSPIHCCQDPDEGFTRVCGPVVPAGVPHKYWKCVGGDGTPVSPYTGVVEMTQLEKDAMDAYLAPDPEPIQVIVAPTGETGGMQARQNEVRFGSITPTNVFLVYDATNYVMLGAGGRVAMGFGLGEVSADDYLAVNGPIRITDAGVRPACAVAIRGQMWVEFNAGGNSDQLYLCRREGGGAYAWTQITP